MLCGETDHLTSFALLLKGDGSGFGDCDDNEDYLIAWLSLAFVAFALVIFFIFVIVFESRMAYRNYRRERLLSSISKMQSQHL